MKKIHNCELYHGDCFDIFPLIPDKSIDAIIADLPYGTTQNKWDSILPLDKLWEDYERIITDNGIVLLTSSQPFTTTLINSNFKLFKYDLVWHKRTLGGVLNAKKMPLRSHETILVFYKKLPTYNPIKSFGNKVCGIKKHTVNSENYRNTNKITDYIDDGSRYPTSVIDITGVVNNSKEKVKHPTQKPIQIILKIIGNSVADNGVTLDTFLGFGTTAVACERLGRKWIGIEISEQYCEIAKKRIQKAEADSYVTCEVNGNPGKLRTDLGWYRTLCDEEYDKALKKRNGLV
jgi:site-specific DNA-methyltransferase (adenine-specific)